MRLDQDNTQFKYMGRVIEKCYLLQALQKH